MVAVKPEHSAGLGGGAKGYLLAIGGAPSVTTGFWTAYDIAAGTWTNLTTSAPYFGLEGQAAVSDPATGQVYIVGGYYTEGNNTVSNRLTVYDPKINKVVTQQAATDKTNLTGAAVVWSTKRNTILSLGGSRATAAAQVSGLQLGAIDEYDPASGVWKTMTTTGNIPTRVLDACAAASDDGSKIVLFGGSLDANTFFSTIYTLDVASAEWTLGQAAPDFRARMACGYHAGQFIAFGGSRGTSQSTILNNIPIIYDVEANTWSPNFDPDGPTGANGGGGGGKGSGKSNLAPIIGGAAGGAVFLTVFGIAVFCCFKRRKASRAKEARDADAKAAASVTNTDEDDRHGQRILLHNYHSGNGGGSHSSPYGRNSGTMSAATMSNAVMSAHDHPYGRSTTNMSAANHPYGRTGGAMSPTAMSAATDNRFDRSAIAMNPAAMSAIDHSYGRSAGALSPTAMSAATDHRYDRSATNMSPTALSAVAVENPYGRAVTTAHAIEQPYVRAGTAMSAADHYAAAAALQTNTAPTSARGTSRYSDTFSQGTSELEHEFAALVAAHSARALSDNGAKTTATATTTVTTATTAIASTTASTTTAAATAIATATTPTTATTKITTTTTDPATTTITTTTSAAAATAAPATITATSTATTNTTTTAAAAEPAAYGNMISVTNSHPPSPALQSFAHSVATSNKTLGGYQLLIQQGDADMQGPHSWPGSYYDPQPISGSVGSVVPAVPPITYSGSHSNNDPHQPWTPTAPTGHGPGYSGNGGNNRGYYEALTTASSTPTSPGFPPVDSPNGWGGSNDNSEPTAVGSDNLHHNHAGNKYVDVGHLRDFGLTTVPRGPQSNAMNVGGASSNYVRPPQH
ncbi:hypothetical protein EC991_009424 [Linnemannia zychae]|nr:hypothetical protein EC991_009424 [Linnemannia zychae]